MSTTSEIVERLRKPTVALEHPLNPEVFCYVPDPLCAEAAEKIDELERENARLREALQLIANAIHPRFRTEDDIDLLYANEKAFGSCINLARAALAGSGEK
jgi:hypothetical protein